MSAITTHVLDAVLGKPAADITLHLELYSQAGWMNLASGSTNADGRCRDLCADGIKGEYRLIFETRPYFESHGRNSLYSEVTIAFQVDGQQNYHIPLLLSDNSYTTYRGS